MDENKKREKHISLGRFFAAIERSVAASTGETRLRGLCLAAVAFLLGHSALPFDTYPLGLALMCAATNGIFYITAGLVACAFTLPLPPALWLSVVAGTLVVRFLVRILLDKPSPEGSLFGEALSLRMACACIAVFATNLYAIIVGGLRYYDLFGALFSLVVTPIAVFLLAGLFENGYGRLLSKEAEASLRWIAQASLCAALCYSLASRSFYGISLAPILAFLVTLTTCRRLGLGRSLIMALATGLVISPATAASLVVAAFTAFCIFDLSPLLAAAVGAIGGTVCGTMILGAEAVGEVFLPLLCGVAIYGTFQKLWHTPQQQETAPAPSPEALLLAQKAKELEDMASAFDRLSGALVTHSRRQKRPSADRMRLLCDDCFDKTCPTCPRKKDCWEAEYEGTLAALDSLASHLAENGTVLADHPALARCPSAEPLAARLRDSVSGLYEGNLAVDHAESFAEGYAVISVLLRELSAPPQQNTVTAATATLTARIGASFHAGEEVCGDVISHFYDRSHQRIYALLCDGMGRGREAAFTAELASLFLRRLLPSGICPDTAMTILDHFLRRGNNGGGIESSTTVDLLILDLSDGTAEFYKCGAAPTYIKRNSNIFCLSAATAPLGILSSAEAKRMTFQLYPGDILLMASDGIGGGEKECVWLLEHLNSANIDDPEGMAEALVKKARQQGGTDDLSAMVLCIDDLSKKA